MTAFLLLPDVEVDPMDVLNGLLQNCCMAPVLFSIFMRAGFQLWTRAVEEFNDVGVPLCYGSGAAILFKRGGDGLATQRDCQSANDSALFASTHGGVCHALRTFMAIASSFGLMVNLSKTKFMAVGADVSLEDRCPLRVCGGELEHVSEFRYLWSIISSGGCCHRNIKSKISSALHAMANGCFTSTSTR